MPQIEAVEREIERLDSIASDIDEEIAKLVDEMETQPQQRKGLNFGGGAQTYSVYVFKPNTPQNELKRKLAADYEAWYNVANELVHTYLPKRADDFEYYYKHTSNQVLMANPCEEGLFCDIRFNQSYIKPEGKYDVAGSIKNQLDCQRNILNSIPGVVNARGMSLFTVISNDLVNSEIGCAEYIFKKNKTHDYCLWVAGILAGIALERHLKTKCESEIGSLPDSPTLSPLIDALYKANKITLNQKKYLEAIATTRNDCAHATATVNRTMVGAAISNVKKHLEGNL